MVVAPAVMLLIGGSYTAPHMDVDVFPDLTAPTVVVVTELHGMAPEEVEKLVFFPIESALNGANPAVILTVSKQPNTMKPRGHGHRHWRTCGRCHH